MEILYRSQAAVRRRLRGEQTPAPRWSDPNHPNAGERWWQDIVTRGGHFGGGELRYDPFRGWWPGAYHSAHVSVDDRGRRVTIQPPVDSPRRVVHMFGGSAMWGWMARDSATIPALVAGRLRAMGYRDIEVVNLAQSTFDLAQNAATFRQQLRLSRAPDVAVFLDGNNEVAPVFQSGRVGAILNESLIARRFDRRLDLWSDLLAVLRHSALVQRLTERPPADTASDHSRLCGPIAESYVSQLRMIQAESGAFGVRPVFLWQPMLATARKSRSSWEARMASDTAWGTMVRRCTASVDSAMAHHRALPYVPLHSMFDSVGESVFLDDYGHLTERGNAAVADSIARLVAERLGTP